jgi:hypothetical protein
MNLLLYFTPFVVAAGVAIVGAAALLRPGTGEVAQSARPIAVAQPAPPIAVAQPAPSLIDNCFSVFNFTIGAMGGTIMGAIAADYFLAAVCHSFCTVKQ